MEPTGNTATLFEFYKAIKDLGKGLLENLSKGSSSGRLLMLKVVVCILLALLLIIFSLLIANGISFYRRNRKLLSRFRESIDSMQSDFPEYSPLIKNCIALGEKIDHKTNRHFNSKKIGLLTFLVAQNDNEQDRMD